MAIHAVVAYSSHWDLDNHRGRIALYDPANKPLDDRAYPNPEEFRLVVDILRHEKPLRFDDAQIVLRTGHEPVGDHE